MLQIWQEVRGLGGPSWLAGWQRGPGDGSVLRAWQVVRCGAGWAGGRGEGLRAARYLPPPPLLLLNVPRLSGCAQAEHIWSD